MLNDWLGVACISMRQPTCEPADNKQHPTDEHSTEHSVCAEECKQISKRAAHESSGDVDTKQKIEDEKAKGCGKQSEPNANLWFSDNGFQQICRCGGDRSRYDWKCVEMYEPSEPEDCRVILRAGYPPQDRRGNGSADKAGCCEVGRRATRAQWPPLTKQANRRPARGRSPRARDVRVERRVRPHVV